MKYTGFVNNPAGNTPNKIIKWRGRSDIYQVNKDDKVIAKIQRRKDGDWELSNRYKQIIGYGSLEHCKSIAKTLINPYKSEAQRRKLHAMAERGEISPDVVAEFDKESEGVELPERVNPAIYVITNGDTGKVTHEIRDRAKAMKTLAALNRIAGYKQYFLMTFDSMGR